MIYSPLMSPPGKFFSYGPKFDLLVSKIFNKTNSQPNQLDKTSYTIPSSNPMSTTLNITMSPVISIQCPDQAGTATATKNSLAGHTKKGKVPKKSNGTESKAKKPLVGHTKKGKPDMRLKINKDNAQLKKMVKKSKGGGVVGQQNSVASSSRRMLSPTEHSSIVMSDLELPFSNQPRYGYGALGGLYSGDRGNTVLPGGHLLRDTESIRAILRKEAKEDNHPRQVADDAWAQCFK